MSAPVKSFTVWSPGYPTYTRGDAVPVVVKLELANDCEVVSLSAKLKGKTSVFWLEAGFFSNTTFKAKECHFCISHDILPAKEGKGNHILTAGEHVFPFTLNFPDKDMPSSFLELLEPGMISYTASARLKRPALKRDAKAKTILNYMSYGNLSAIVPELMSPQEKTKTRNKLWFHSGTVKAELKLEHMGYLKAKGVDVVLSLENNSSTTMRAELNLYRKVTASVPRKNSSHKKVRTKTLVTEDLGKVLPFTNQTFQKVVSFPATASPSILDCSILKVEYRLSVWVFMKCALNFVFKMPIVLLPDPQPPLPADDTDDADGRDGTMELRRN